MTNNRDMARHGLRTGPGGIGCPCCTPYYCHPRKAKPLIRRHMRRKDKQELRRDSLQEAREHEVP